jgi:hypothetical protein
MTVARQLGEVVLRFCPEPRLRTAKPTALPPRAKPPCRQFRQVDGTILHRRVHCHKTLYQAKVLFFGLYTTLVIYSSLPIGVQMPCGPFEAS